MSFPITRCSTCGKAVFPARVLCPSCGGRSWTTVNEESGAIDAITTSDGVGIALVRLRLGPLVVARVHASVQPGEKVKVIDEGGIPVAVPLDDAD